MQRARTCAMAGMNDDEGKPPVGYASLSRASMQDRMNTVSRQARSRRNATCHGKKNIDPRHFIHEAPGLDERGASLTTKEDPFQIVGSLD